MNVAPLRIGLGRASYIGGVSRYPKRIAGPFWATEEALGIGSSGPVALAFDIGEITSVDVESVDEAKSRAGYVAAFGVLGLAAKASKRKVILSVVLRLGETAFFEFQDITAIEMRAKLSVWRARVLKPVPTTHDVSSELERLAALHASGALSDAEFTAAKSMLLGS